MLNTVALPVTLILSQENLIFSPIFSALPPLMARLGTNLSFFMIFLSGSKPDLEGEIQLHIEHGYVHPMVCMMCSVRVQRYQLVFLDPHGPGLHINHGML